MLLVGVSSACTRASSPEETPAPTQMVDGGSWYVREQWPHDGVTVESADFIVYSDGASLESRRRLADLAEQVLAEVIDEMGIDPSTMFRFPPGQDKIDIYAYRYHVLEGGGARGYYAGMIFPSLDNEAGNESTDIRAVRINMKHELVHVVEALLKGRFVGDVPADDPSRMPVWFSEGTAEALSGRTVRGAPRTLDEVGGLIAEFGRINPISWKVDLPPSDAVLNAYAYYYYPMANLAVQYLLDPRGLGRSPKDLAAVMLDLGNGVSFADSFEQHFGITESDYETQFFDRIDAYLPQHQSPLGAIVLAVASLVAAGLMGASLLWGFGRWPVLAAGAGSVGEPVSGGAGGRAFLVEVSMAAVLAAGFVALLAYRIASADLPSYVSRTPGYLVAAADLVASGGILVWSIRRRAVGGRGSYLTPLLVLAAIGVTAVVIGWLL